MSKLTFPISKKARLANIDPGDTSEVKNKQVAKQEVEKYLKQIYDLHYTMYAENKHSMAIILQGIDASGKDGVVRHICSGLNPQGYKVYSFKRPSDIEIAHDYLWRIHNVMPVHGEIAICNRSHYEEVTVVKVHPQHLEPQHLPSDALIKDIFKQRYRQINDFERMLSENGTHVVKLFLHISKDEQKKRLEDRLNDRTKHWKFSEADVIERRHWDTYMEAFEDMLDETNTKYAPWYVIPADNKWYRDYMVSRILLETLESFKMKFPASKPNHVKIV
ncbi:MAG: polyphosphate kinase 2 family protein [Chlorobiales bacterium]|jgi:PPK2 family polyphosphate:nucleotide phosphotransferase|nr:polyphosphate kinase 2 family protein [Chlorobiales bacterium]